MIMKRYDLWEEGEYVYPASFGFRPNIRSYIHEDRGFYRPCIIVVPGGGYRVVSPTEGELVAKKFYDKGYQAFVCTYTINITGTEPLKDQSLKYLGRAVRYIRKNAKEFGIDKEKIAVCGFSAGGHLCGSLCTHFKDVKEYNANYVDYSSRPDAGILCYPVISSEYDADSESFEMLLGKEASKEELQYTSLEKQVTKDTPPCFIWQTATDELVPVENSYLMARALKEQGVLYAHHVFATGQHGLSLANKDWADENYGEPYTLEQVFGMVEAVKSGKLPCSKEDKKQLLEAFDYNDEQAENHHIKNIPNEEVEIWPDMVSRWLEIIFSSNK